MIWNKTLAKRSAADRLAPPYEEAAALAVRRLDAGYALLPAGTLEALRQLPGDPGWLAMAVRTMLTD